MAFLGICFLALACLLAFSILREVRGFVGTSRRGVTARAEVVGIDTYYGQASVRRSPVVRFTTAHGEMVTTELRGPRTRGTSVGDRIEIQYLPERPRTARPWGAGFPCSSVVWPALTGAFFVALGVRLLS